MTRGKILYVTKDKQVYSTIEFNGDMYPFDGGHGEEIIDFFQKQGFRDVYSYQRYVKRLDSRYFGYMIAYDEELIHFRGLYREGLFDFTKNYTDYLYLINHSDGEVQMELEEGKRVVPAGALAVVCFQNLQEIIPGNEMSGAGVSEKSVLVKMMENMDWDLFQHQKEWLNAQQIQIEKWYGKDAANLPAGILNMMDKVQNVWEEEMEREDRNGCWYEEKWYDEDLRTVLEEANVEATAANIAKLRNRCVHIFDDKSARNEMLVDMARKMNDSE